MSKKKKTEISDLEMPVEEQSMEESAETPSRPKVPFTHWVDKMIKKGKIRYYQDEALLVFFKKQGLKNLEDEDTYNKAFERF